MILFKLIILIKIGRAKGMEGKDGKEVTCLRCFVRLVDVMWQLRLSCLWA